MDVWVNMLMNEWMGSLLMHGCIDGSMDGWMDGWTDRWDKALRNITR